MVRLAPSLFLLLITTILVISAAPSKKDLHSRFFQEENMEKHMSNDIGDVLPRYKSAPKLNRILFGGSKGTFRKNNKKGPFQRRKNHGKLGGLLGHKGEQKWRRQFPQRVKEIHYQDVSYDVPQSPPLRRPIEVEIPETPRMTPNRLRRVKKNKNNRRKAQKKSIHAKRVHHLNKLRQLGKNHDEKALWKLMNHRAKLENHSSTP
ncbi:unnamed protein product [Lepeophtheirus salmonis]|uniref:(salmon louse) hypothetical protein n=2 Tax=Lepeophtheirus salmonis TaxID=72036 RepID=A0A7R8CIY6_LEPSM|nr:uncharacterized protein LOC121128550 [Lepeophtheirus salmonis]CAB4058684.1 unnamed protein product [Lepeophtheirus salmonis]CAF2837617.1 unnamed protein product [Lepeophtheirus salmonis]